MVNVVPQTRQERKAKDSREVLEKTRLRQRKEGFCHYEEGGLTPFGPESLSHISEKDRFITDIAGVNKIEREQEVAKREQMYHNRRVKKAEMEEERWRTIETRFNLDMAREAEQRQNAAYARSNKTSMPYNPINLRYDDGVDGDRLRYSDASMLHRGALRSEHLQRRGMSTPFHPITGDMVPMVHVPPMPERPPQ